MATHPQMKNLNFFGCLKLIFYQVPSQLACPNIEKRRSIIVRLTKVKIRYENVEPQNNANSFTLKYHPKKWEIHS